MSAFSDAVIEQLARTTGRRRDVLTADHTGLVLEQPPAAQVEVADAALLGQVRLAVGIDVSGNSDGSGAGGTVADARASLSMLQACGVSPFLVPDVTVVPADLTEEETAAWGTLLDLYDTGLRGWCLVGGQMTHAHCWQRGITPPRVTTDADVIVDLRADRGSLVRITEYLSSQGYVEDGRSPANIGHRWVRGRAAFDILIPEGLSQTAAKATTSTGAHTVQVPGGTQALDRAQAIAVQLPGRQGTVIRPSLLGALVGKAAALEIAVDPARDRHLADFVTLAAMIDNPVTMRTLVTKKDRQRVARMLHALATKPRMWNASVVGEAGPSIVATAFGIDSESGTYK